MSIRALVLGLVAGCILPGQTAPALPVWLAPPAGALQESMHSAGNHIEATYTLKPGAQGVVDHYLQQLRKAGLRAESGPDGLGTTIKASGPQHSVLIRVRADDEAVRVRVGCVTERRVWALARSPQAASASLAGAPVLDWPGWLGPLPGHRFEQAPAEVRTSPSSYWMATFTTAASVEHVRDYYRRLLEGNGHRVSRASLNAHATGSTGEVVGAAHRREIRVTFSRRSDSGPFRVSLTVRPSGR